MGCVVILLCCAVPFSPSQCLCNSVYNCTYWPWVINLLSGIAPSSYLQIQAVTSVGAGNFSSPVIVELDGSSEPRSSSAVGITVAVIIIMLSVVVAFLIICMYIIIW